MPRRIGGRKLWPWVVVAGVIAYGLAWSGALALVGFPNASVIATGRSHPDLKVISDTTGLNFPPGCRVVHSSLRVTDWFGSSEMEAEVALPPGGALGFLASLPRSVMRSHEAVASWGLPRDRPRWWGSASSAMLVETCETRSKPSTQGYVEQGLAAEWIAGDHIYLAWSTL